MEKKNILVLSGGGIKGVSYMGCLIALQELGHYENIDTFAGASIGGLISALCILGYTPDELKKFIVNFEIGKAKCINFLGIVLEFGLDNGSKLELVIKKLISAKKYSENITLSELYNSTKKNLYLTTTCVNNKKIVCLNYTTHPNLPLYTAIRMTTAIPFFYTPVKYENKLYIDGGCMDNYPISLFNDRLDKVIGLYLCDDDDDVIENIDNIEAYLSKVIQCLMMGVDQNYVQRFHQCTTVIKLKNINSINYDISSEKKEELCNIGYDCIIKNFTKFVEK